MFFRQFALLICIISNVILQAQSTVYVATTGDDSNSGSLTEPFQSLEQALITLKATGGTCYIRAGVYHEEIALSNLNNITIQAYNNEEVIFDGTEEITSSWTQSSFNPNVYETTLTKDIWQLFIDHEQQVMARWPNAQFKDKSIFEHKNWALGLEPSAGSTDTYMKTDESGSLPKLSNINHDLTGAMVIANVGSWKTYARTVTSHSAGSPNFNYTKAGSFVSKHLYYYLECAKELIDTHNEWFYDKSTKKLYVYGDPSHKLIQGKTQSYALNGSSSSHVAIKGINFFGTTVRFSHSNNITLEECTFSYPSCSKRMLQSEAAPLSTELMTTNNSHDGNMLIKKCLFEHTDGEGLFLKGKHLSLPTNKEVCLYFLGLNTLGEFGFADLQSF